MNGDEYVEADPCPCDDCPDFDRCDGWESQFCCELCIWSGGGWNCEECDPWDI